jgi:hypothetical protein
MEQDRETRPEPEDIRPLDQEPVGRARDEEIDEEFEDTDADADEELEEK